MLVGSLGNFDSKHVLRNLSNVRLRCHLFAFCVFNTMFLSNIFDLTTSYPRYGFAPAIEFPYAPFSFRPRSFPAFGTRASARDLVPSAGFSNQVCTCFLRNALPIYIRKSTIETGLIPELSR